MDGPLPMPKTKIYMNDRIRLIQANRQHSRYIGPCKCIHARCGRVRRVLERAPVLGQSRTVRWSRQVTFYLSNQLLNFRFKNFQKKVSIKNKVARCDQSCSRSIRLNYTCVVNPPQGFYSPKHRQTESKVGHSCVSAFLITIFYPCTIISETTVIFHQCSRCSLMAVSLPSGGPYACLPLSLY